MIHCETIGGVEINSSWCAEQENRVSFMSQVSIEPSDIFPDDRSASEDAEKSMIQKLKMKSAHARPSIFPPASYRGRSTGLPPYFFFAFQKLRRRQDFCEIEDDPYKDSCKLVSVFFISVPFLGGYSLAFLAEKYTNNRKNLDAHTHNCYFTFGFPLSFQRPPQEEVRSAVHLQA